MRKFNSIYNTYFFIIYNNEKYLPLGPTISLTWDTVVPDAAPRYSTLLFGLIYISDTPPMTAAAILERYGFHTLYST